VLIDVIKTGKAAKRATDKYFPNGAFPDSLKSVSIRSPKSSDS